MKELLLSNLAKVVYYSKKSIAHHFSINTPSEATSKISWYYCKNEQKFFKNHLHLLQESLIVQNAFLDEVIPFKNKSHHCYVLKLTSLNCLRRLAKLQPSVLPVFSRVILLYPSTLRHTAKEPWKLNYIKILNEVLLHTSSKTSLHILEKQFLVNQNTKKTLLQLLQ